MNNPPGSRTAGFTLVELLVVVVIIASLAALSFTVGPKMLRNAKATDSLQNLRQLGPLFGAYAVDHELKLPPAFGPRRGLAPCPRRGGGGRRTSPS